MHSDGSALPLPVMTVVAVLGGCATRPGPETLDPVSGVSDGARNVTVLAVTDRSPTQATPPAFTGGRGKLGYEVFSMQAIRSSADGRPDAPVVAISDQPAKDFVTVGRRELGRAAFEEMVGRQQKVGDGTVLVFVHGYNTSYQEAVFQLAQLSADSGARTRE